MELVYLVPFGALIGATTWVTCYLIRVPGRSPTSTCFLVGFFIGAVLWTFKVSLWAGVSNWRRSNHLPLSLADKAWCFLYDHVLIISIAAGIIVAIVWRANRSAVGANGSANGSA